MAKSSLRKTKWTPTRRDVGKLIVYKPDGEQGILANVEKRGAYLIAAYDVVGPRGGVKYHASTDIRNLELVTQEK